MIKRLQSGLLWFGVLLVVTASWGQEVVQGPGEWVTPIFRDIRDLPQADEVDNKLELPKIFIKRVHKQKLAEYDPRRTSEGAVTIDHNVSDFSVAALNLGRGFLGPPRNEYDPPDPDIAAGPNHVIVVNNDDIGIYTKDGARLALIDANTLFSSDEFIFDSWAAYDNWEGRFLVLFARFNSSTSQSSWELAVSRTSDPINGGWWLYRVNGRTLGSQDRNVWPDYEKVGFNRDVVVLSANMFGFGGGFFGSQIVVMSKAQVYHGQTAQRYDFAFQNDVTAQPAEMHTQSPDEDVFYCITSSANSGSSLTLRKILGPARFFADGTPPTVVTEAVPVSAFASPPNGRQPGGSIDNIDARMLNATLYHNLLTCAHGVAFNWNDSQGNRGAIKIYQLEVSPTQPTIVRQDRIYGAPGYDYFYPAAQINRDKDLIISVGRSSSSPAIFAQALIVGWRANTAQPTDSVTVRNGTGTYVGGRWGDYFGVGLDPIDNRTVWTVGQAALSTGSWELWTQEVSYIRQDVNGDGCVNDLDLLAVLFAFGLTGERPEDLDLNGVVNDEDLLIVILAFGNGCPQPPAAPSNLRSTRIQRTFVDLAWDDNSFNENGFKVYISRDNEFWVEAANLPANSVSARIQPLFPNTLYFFRVQAYNDQGVSPFSNTLQLQTLP